MALIQCPECGKKISDKALSCPNCGFPLNIETESVTPPTKKKIELIPERLWSGDTSPYEFYFKGGKKNRAKGEYSYKKILEAIGLSGKIAVSGFLGEMPAKLVKKLSEDIVAEGICIDSDNINRFEELLSLQSSLISYQKKIKASAEDFIKITGLNIKVSLYDIAYIEKTAVEVIRYDREEYDRQKKTLEIHLDALKGKKQLSEVASMMMMSPGSKPMSTSTSAMIGGVIAGTPGAVYGALKGYEKQKNHDSFVASYNASKNNYSNKIQGYEAEIWETNQQLSNLEIPKYTAEEKAVILGLRTLVGIIPIFVKIDDPKINIQNQGKNLTVKELSFLQKSSSLEKRFRKFQLQSFMEDGKISTELRYNPVMIKDLDENAGYKEYLDKQKALKDSISKEILSVFNNSKKTYLSVNDFAIENKLLNQCEQAEISRELDKLVKAGTVYYAKNKYSLITDSFKEKQSEKLKNEVAKIEEEILLLSDELNACLKKSEESNAAKNMYEDQKENYKSENDPGLNALNKQINELVQSIHNCKVSIEDMEKEVTLNEMSLKKMHFWEAKNKGIKKKEIDDFNSNIKEKENQCEQMKEEMDSLVKKRDGMKRQYEKECASYDEKIKREEDSVSSEEKRITAINKNIKAKQQEKMEIEEEMKVLLS